MEVQKPVNILLIEDNPGDARLIRELLKETQPVHMTSFSFTHVTRLETGIPLLAAADVVLLDLSLPDSHGLQTFITLQAQPATVPIIVLTGFNDESVAVEAMQLGAQDYLVKGNVDSGALARAVRYAIERQRLVTELAQKAAELEAHNLELDAFSHTIAHQIRSPLSQVMAYAEYAELNYASELNEELQMVLNRIQQSGHKMNNIISELLLLASIRSNNEIAVVPLEMKYLVSEARKRLRMQIEASHAEISMPEIWPPALGYGPWIEEVWVNYMSNAIKYGGTPPQITLGAKDMADGKICFWIRDNGVGISPEDIGRLFKAHSRLRQAYTNGEGVGLSIVHRIVQKCGGEVGVESELNVGSTFWFTLPPVF